MKIDDYIIVSSFNDKLPPIKKVIKIALKYKNYIYIYISYEDITNSFSLE